jgi:GTP-binding protein
VLFLIDASEPVSEPDKKLAAYIAEQYKPVVLVINKWDIARAAMADADENFRDGDAMEKFGKYLGEELRFLDYAPIAFTTAKDGKNVQQVLDLAGHLANQSAFRVGTGKLNTALEAVLAERAPSAPRRAIPKVYYATQVDVSPPTIVLFVNRPEYIDENYRRFVVNRFRELLPYGEVPIKIEVRGKQREPGQKPGQKPPGKPSGRKPSGAPQKSSPKLNAQVNPNKNATRIKGSTGRGRK